MGDRKFICEKSDDCEFIEKNTCYHAVEHDFCQGGCNRQCAFLPTVVCVPVVDSYKCKCGSTQFEIMLNCKLKDVCDDTAYSSLVCSNCNEEVYSFVDA